MKVIVVGVGLAGLTCAKVLTVGGAEVLATGAAAVPARGMDEISRQLASHLPEGVVNLNSPIENLLREGDRVSGVEVAGEEHEADVVVVATDAPTAGSLRARRCRRGR